MSLYTMRVFIHFPCKTKGREKKRGKTKKHIREGLFPLFSFSHWNLFSPRKKKSRGGKRLDGDDAYADIRCYWFSIETQEKTDEWTENAIDCRKFYSLIPYHSHLRLLITSTSFTESKRWDSKWVEKIVYYF